MIPFVSLRAHLAVIAQLKEAHALIGRMAQLRAKEVSDVRAQCDAHAVRLLENARTNEERADRRYADLMASYRQLKLVGAVEVVPPPKIEPPPVDKVDQAILRYARDASLIPGMRQRAADERAKGTSDEEIVNMIRRGSRPAEEMAS